MNKTAGYFLVLLCLFLFSGCEKGTGAAPKPPKGQVIAKVNDWHLTAEDFNQQVEAIIKANEGEAVVPVNALGLLARTFIPPFVSDIDFKSVEGKTLYLELMVNLELLAAEAEAQKLPSDPEIAKDIRRSKVEILDFALLNDVLKKVTVTPLEIEEFYQNEYKKTLEAIDQRKVREIVVDSEAKATGILVELLQGADFSSLATARSKSESAAKGGDLGYLVYQPTKKFKKFWEAVLMLEPGKISSIFKDPEKEEYYIIKVEDVKKGEPESLSKIYDQLEFLLKQKKSIEAIDKLIAGIKEKVAVEIHSDLIK